MKIRTKLSLFTGLVVIVTTTAVAYLGYRLQKESILKNQTEAQMTQTAGLGSVCRQASIVKNDLLMINYVRLLLETKGITYAYFVDSEGVIRSHSDKKFLYNNIQSWHEKKPQGVIESK